MPISRVRYSERAHTALNVRAPGSKALRFGAEIETGWHDEHSFTKFHNALEAKGLHDKVVSKPDGSISAAFQAEIVTLPFGASALRDVVGDIADTLAEHARSVTIAGCGVHVHASRGNLTDLEKTKYMSAVMFGTDSWICQNLPTPDNAHAQVRHLHKFWDLIALREQTRFCRRAALESRSLLRNSSHDYACILSAENPTLEMRIFKTCRSPKVLRSYPEVAASLLAFVQETTPKEKDSKHKTLTVEEWWKANMAEFISYGGLECYWDDEIRPILTKVVREQGHTNPRQCRLGYCDQEVEHRAERGQALTDAGFAWETPFDRFRDGTLRWNGLERSYSQAQTNCSSGEGDYGHFWETIVIQQERVLKGRSASRSHYYCLVPDPSDHKKILAHYGGNVPTVMWETGIMPVEAYTEFILSNVGKYPNLASRLELPRFSPFLPGGIVTPVEEAFEFDRAQPHDDLGRGCHVALQGQPSHYTVTKYRDGVLHLFEDGQEVTAEDILHVCEGASRLEVWGE